MARVRLSLSFEYNIDESKLESFYGITAAYPDCIHQALKIDLDNFRDGPQSFIEGVKDTDLVFNGEIVSI